MGNPLITVVDASVAPEREQELLDGFRQLNQGPKPDGFVRSELLRRLDGGWRIQTTWRDREALMAVRASGRPPAALALLDQVGAEHGHAVFTVEQSFEA